MPKYELLEIAKLTTELFKRQASRSKYLFKLFNLEARLAKKSLKGVVLLSLLFILLVISAWFSLITFILFLLHSFKISWLVSSLIVVIINVTLLATVYLILVKLKNNIFFPRTSKVLLNMMTKQKDFNNGKLKSAN